ncbi:Ribosome biogenesis protein TSR1 [Nosema granulosis]|uniref:Ribosome biogenesis protein TSR1 n=1 Tax=Nosema granulosis TaxID=83296 RepID=A0A9P6GVP1_9MICR|nr:Ribosome biogenesis protein TSR1 [Nosema granulosis]
MKIKDKRNRNKIKKENKKIKQDKEHEVYSTANGPYKTVAFVTLGGQNEKIRELLKGNEMNLYFYKEKKTNFMFIDTFNLSEYDCSFICRASDIVVFVIDSDEIDTKKLFYIKKNLPSCIFVITDKKYKKTARNTMERHVPDKKIVEMKSLLDHLCLFKISNTTICKRPYLVPFSVSHEGEFIKVKGFLKKGFVSDSVTVNGKYEMKIEEVQADRRYSGEEFNLKDEEREQFAVNNDFNEDEMEIEEIDDSNETFSGDEMSEVSSEVSEEDRPNLIELYKEYRGIRDIATCDFPTDKYPPFYKDLIFFNDFKAVEKFITKRESCMPDNQIVDVTLRWNGPPINDKIFILFNNYEYENLRTIHNFIFNVKEKPLDTENIIVDFGHRLLKVKPTLTKEANQNVFKKEESLYNGVVSFIAPIIFDATKIVAFYDSPSLETYKFTGVSGFIKERKLYDEVVLSGRPEKVYKRSCIVRKMFFTKNEVLFFKNIRLYSKNGRSSGFIKKPIGVHGRFRAYFSNQLPPGGKIYMSLYKRAFLDNQTE